MAAPGSALRSAHAADDSEGHPDERVDGQRDRRALPRFMRNRCIVVVELRPAAPSTW